MLARWTAPHLIEELRRFKTHEERHRSIFAAELAKRNSHRCRSYHFCALGGFVLGMLTGLMGASAISATTVTVERVVLRHFYHQLHLLGETDPEVSAAIRAIITEENEHHDHSNAHLDKMNLWLKLLMPVVSASTESVIWLGMRL